ncbi:YihY/virulence factor BrkB family protein [Thiohalobacter thiocyanaticus]|uniref:YihY/virulence factor BrkB family protein n=1 Tax=Thiohalobacter thiocyanaticus TaxID=585455 RepID=A0A426QMN4_9GAMM|nr:YihY/virulence factor BrkB family protein [Thiohalobacter thiocyanaticus]RRQ23009.1 YihY/virulence factor BrkB family protein [Thiohalobacter thiocyanaticus]
MTHTNTGTAEARERKLGRHASVPSEIPWRGWRRVMARVWGEIGRRNLGLVAAGVAFYGLLALFPAIAALIAVYGLVADPAHVSQQFAILEKMLPADAYTLLQQQMQQLATRPDGKLGLGLAGAVVLSVWSSTKGSRSIIAAMNIAYREREKRGIIRLNLIAYAMTLGLVLVAVVVIALVVAVPIVLNLIGLGGLVEVGVNVLRWLLLAGVVLVMLASIYRFGPARKEARWQWVSWGAVLALLLWLLTSALFSFYVSRFGSYNATYGSVGAVVILLLWLFITAFAVILGAVLNGEMEYQTGRDTIHHHERPMGERGAFVADHLPTGDSRRPKE